MGHGQACLEGLVFPLWVSHGKGGGMPLKFLPSVLTHFRGANRKSGLYLLPLAMWTKGNSAWMSKLISTFHTADAVHGA